MMDYQTAVRGAFFDIAGVAETPDEVAAQARYLDDGLLFLQEGKIIALLPWQQGEAFLHPWCFVPCLRHRWRRYSAKRCASICA